MKKPKVVCVVGSAVLAPLSIAVPAAAVGCLGAAIMLHWGLQLPAWTLWSEWLLLPVSVWCLMPLIRYLYGIFFDKCYQTPQS